MKIRARALLAAAAGAVITLLLGCATRSEPITATPEQIPETRSEPITKPSAVSRTAQAVDAVTLDGVWIEEPGYCGERLHIAGNIFVYANKYFRLAGSYRVEDGLIRATVGHSTASAISQDDPRSILKEYPDCSPQLIPLLDPNTEGSVRLHNQTLVFDIRGEGKIFFKPWDRRRISASGSGYEWRLKVFQPLSSLIDAAQIGDAQALRTLPAGRG